MLPGCCAVLNPAASLAPIRRPSPRPPPLDPPQEAEMQKAALEDAAERRRNSLRQCEVAVQQLGEAEKAAILAYT